MKCPKCGYTSFDYLDECKKCGKDLAEHKDKYSIRSLMFPGQHSET
jgi:ribosomal protein S27AE